MKSHEATVCVSQNMSLSPPSFSFFFVGLGLLAKCLPIHRLRLVYTLIKICPKMSTVNKVPCIKFCANYIKLYNKSVIPHVYCILTVGCSAGYELKHLSRLFTHSSAMGALLCRYSDFIDTKEEERKRCVKICSVQYTHCGVNKLLFISALPFCGLHGLFFFKRQSRRSIVLCFWLSSVIIATHPVCTHQSYTCLRF